MNFKYHVNNLNINIRYDNEFYTAYLEREFGLLKSENTDNSIDIAVTIKHCQYKLSSDARPIRKNFWIWKGVLIQKLVAFRRMIWIEYNSLQDIILFVEYEDKEFFEQLMNPFFEPRSIACLSDFFHNPFLLILQINLMPFSGALFHCSSYVDLKNNMFVLSGIGQTGKSSIVRTMLGECEFKFSSEDFSFVFSDSRIFGYPHQCRVTGQELMRKLDKGICNYTSIFDRINYFVYHKILRRGNGRHLSVNDYYESNRFERMGIKPCVYVLNRNCEKYSCIKMDVKEFLDYQSNIIITEIKNMASATDLIDSLNDAHFYDCNLEQLFLQIRNIYQEFYNNCSGVYLVNLPIYNDICDAAEAVLKIER